jgi:hypothetical protein
MRLPHKKYAALVARYNKQIVAATKTWDEIGRLSVRCLPPEAKARAKGDWAGNTYQSKRRNLPIEDLDSYITWRFQQGWSEDNYLEGLPEDLMDTLEGFLEWICTDGSSPCCEFPEEDE